MDMKIGTATEIGENPDPYGKVRITEPETIVLYYPEEIEETVVHESLHVVLWRLKEYMASRALDWNEI